MATFSLKVQSQNMLSTQKQLPEYTNQLFFCFISQKENVVANTRDAVNRIAFSATEKLSI